MPKMILELKWRKIGERLHEAHVPEGVVTVWGYAWDYRWFLDEYDPSTCLPVLSCRHEPHKVYDKAFNCKIGFERFYERHFGKKIKADI